MLAVRRFVCIGTYISVFPISLLLSQHFSFCVSMCVFLACRPELCKSKIVSFKSKFGSRFSSNPNWIPDFESETIKFDHPISESFSNFFVEIPIPKPYLYCSSNWNWNYQITNVRFWILNNVQIQIYLEYLDPIPNQTLNLIECSNSIYLKCSNGICTFSIFHQFHKSCPRNSDMKIEQFKYALLLNSSHY